MAIINASACTRAAVSTAITAAVDGDTVVVPAGTAIDWTSQLNVTKGIIIQGQTTCNSVTGVCNDQSIIVDNLAVIGGGQGFFNFTTNTGQSLRLSGFTFTGVGDTRGTQMSNGAIKFNGTSDQVRIDNVHCTGQLFHTNFIAVYPSIYGVADHIVIDTLRSQMCQNRVFNGHGNGDLEFSVGADYGSKNFWFFEDCYIKNLSGNFTASGGVDCLQGGKFVVRYCYLENVEILNHGTQDGRVRGGRAQEIYNNTYSWNHTGAMDGIRTGSLIAHDNNFIGIKPTGYGMQSYRLIYGYTSGTWKGASGDNNWDYNVTEADGTHIDGHPPFLFQSGTLTSVTGTTVLTDNTKSWTTNQWQNYQVKRTSDGATAYIASNTATSMTIVQWQSQGFAAGNGYQIHKPLKVLDQPGRGAGALIEGSNPTPFWPDPVLEPCYSWNNVHTDLSTINWIPSPNTAYLVDEGRDYYSDTVMPGYTPYTYPHPLVSGVALGKIISLSGDMTFGNVTIGETLQSTLSISNIGDTLLTVTNITLPTGFTITGTTSFTVAAGAHVDRTITFTPLLEQLYSGTITVVSDKNSGTNTIACSGTGVAAGGGTGRGHKKSVLIRRVAP